MTPVSIVTLYRNDDGSHTAVTEAAGLRHETRGREPIADLFERCATVIAGHLERKMPTDTAPVELPGVVFGSERP